MMPSCTQCSITSQKLDGLIFELYAKDRPTMPYSTAPGEEDLEYVSEELPDPRCPASSLTLLHDLKGKAQMLNPGERGYGSRLNLRGSSLRKLTQLTKNLSL